VTSDAGLLAYRELGLTDGEVPAILSRARLGQDCCGKPSLDGSPATKT